VGICLIPYETISRFATVIYWLSIALLLSVMIFGTTRFGAKRWIDLGFFQFQPSEFAKIAMIFMQASYLSRSPEELRDPKLFMKALGLILLPFILILKEPDLGSALVLFPIGFGVMLVAGVPMKFLRRFIGGVPVLIVLLLIDIVFAPPSWQIKLE
jgi:rod shape determining protein RodA